LRENVEAIQDFHAGWRKSGIGGADGKYGLYEFTQTHVVQMQRHRRPRTTHEDMGASTKLAG
jgi:lactaldehyde dehydrogenase/glycolaldehyde dehydrogenase